MGQVCFTAIGSNNCACHHGLHCPMFQLFHAKVHSGSLHMFLWCTFMLAGVGDKEGEDTKLK